MGEFTDPRDGQKYRTVKIGDREWMAENLRYKIDGGSCCYDNDEANNQKYGRLYSWEAAKMACPEGWHLPTKDDVDKLNDVVGDSWSISVSERLKATSGWNNGNGTDSHGFSALPGGVRLAYDNFRHVGNQGFWWCTGNDVNVAYFLGLCEDDGGAAGGMGVGEVGVENVSFGFSVRCVRKYGEKTEAEKAPAIASFSSTSIIGRKTGDAVEDKKNPVIGALVLGTLLLLGAVAVFFSTQPINVNRSSNADSESAAEVEEESGYFVDARDGQSYGAVTIGNAVWMTQNLNYRPQTGKSWCYNGNNSNCAGYGRLYDWNTATAVCPDGWHLASRREWARLAAATGGDKAGTALKSESGWEGNGANTYGFSALPGGSRSVDGDFKNAGNRGLWWVADEYDSDSAYYRRMGSNYDYVYEGTFDKRYGFSVRCVEDAR